MGKLFTPRILLVNTIEKEFVLLQSLLCKVKAKIVHFCDIKKALIAINKDEFVMVILNGEIPKAEELEFMKRVRHPLQSYPLPVILLKANCLDNNRKFSGYESSVVDVIYKPFNSGLFVNKVNLFLELFRQKHKLQVENQQLEDTLEKGKVLENYLRSCALNYRAIIEDQSELIFRITQEKKINFINHALADFVKVPVKQIIGRDVSELGTDMSVHLEDVLSKLSPQVPIAYFEGPFWSGQMEEKWIEWSVRVELDGYEKVNEYLIVGRDITEKKQVQDALIKKEKMFSKAQRLAKLGSWEWDSCSQLLWISEEIYQIYGIGASEKINSLKDIIRYVHVDDRNMLDRIFSSLPKKNQKIKLQHRVMLQDGTLRYIHMELSTSYQMEDNLLRISGISQDITEHKLSEVALKENLTQLFEITDSLPQTIYEVNCEGKLVYLNKVGSTFLNCKKLTLGKGQNFKKFFIEEERERLQQMLAELYRGKEVLVGEFTLQIKNDVRNVIMYAVPTYENRKIKGARGILLDITRRVEGEKKLQENFLNSVQTITSLKQTEEEILDDNRKLKRRVEEETQNNELQRQLLIQKSKLESLGKLAGSMVHEISQHIAVISMIMDNMWLRITMNKIDKGYFKDKCKQVFNGIERINKYLNHIGAYSSMQKETRKEQINVNEIVVNALRLIKNKYKNWGVSLRQDLYPDPIPIYGNRYKLEQVFVDLLVNSYESLEEKYKLGNSRKKARWIKISSGIKEKEAVICIADNGNGIENDNMNYIFEPFFSTKKPGASSGLGLYIINDIVQKMGGSIKVKSTKNEFTEVTVILPLMKKEEKQKIQVENEYDTV